VERTLERDHARAACVQARQLDRVLDRLRAGVEERSALLARDRRQRAEALGELDRGLVGDDREVRVEESRGLLHDGLDDPWVPVPRVHHADAAGEVDEHVPVDIGDGGILRPLGEDRKMDEERPGDHVRLPLGERARARAGDRRTNVDRPRGGHRL